MSLPIVVVKLGGSLLSWPEFPQRLTKWLESQAPSLPVLVIGGGFMADQIRGLDSIHKFGEPIAHRLALRSLDTTGYLVHELMNGKTRVVSSIDLLGAVWDAGLIPILLPREVLERDDRVSPGEALPHNWDVTTDAIAGRIACLISAARVVLLKSAPAPRNLAEAAALGLVDPWFDRTRGSIIAEYVNLRGWATESCSTLVERQTP